MRMALIIADDEELSRELGAVLISHGYEIHMSGDREAAVEYDLVIAPPPRFGEPKPPVDKDIVKQHSERIYELFSAHSTELGEYIKTVKKEIHSCVADPAEAERILKDIYRSVVDKAFDENEWLDLYFVQESFTDKFSAALEEKLLILHREYNELFPTVSGDEEKLIIYILNNPESDLRQKTLASKMYMNSSYLSTVFAAKTGGRFVDYLTTVKLKRAAYLLMNSDLRVSEIAARLDYKDIGYFSRMFKARYGMPPSEYRMPENYIYII